MLYDIFSFFIKYLYRPIASLSQLSSIPYHSIELFTSELGEHKYTAIAARMPAHPHTVIPFHFVSTDALTIVRPRAKSKKKGETKSEPYRCFHIQFQKFVLVTFQRSSTNHPDPSLIGFPIDPYILNGTSARTVAHSLSPHSTI